MSKQKKQSLQKPFRFSETELAIIANLDTMDPGAQRSFELPFRTNDAGARIYYRLEKLAKWYECYKSQAGSEYAQISLDRSSQAPGTVFLSFVRGRK